MLNDILKSQISTSAYNTLLTVFEPTLNDIIEKEEKEAIKDNRPSLSDFAKDSIRFGYMFKIVTSLAKYLKDTDEVEVLRFYTGNKGFEVSAVVTRNDKKFAFNTTTIIAMGEVQKMHVRYLIDTNLPKEQDTQTLNRIKSIKKARTKVERAIENVEYAKTVHAKQISFCERQSLLTDSEVLENTERYTMINKGWKPENYQPEQGFGLVHESQETWDAFIKGIETEVLESHRNSLEASKQTIKVLFRNIAKEEKKLEKSQKELANL